MAKARQSSSSSRRASPAGKPPAATRMTDALGMQLVAALDDTLAPPTLPPTPMLRAATQSLEITRARSDTFDSIYALGDVDGDDVDMADLDVIDADVFRPSALMDRKLDDEYGRTSDLERMLLLSDAQLDDDEDVAVMAHLAQLDSLQQQSSQSFAPLAPRSGRWFVSSSHGQADIAATLPPKYLEGGALASPHKRRVHKRLFGEHTTTFSFKFPNATSVASIADTTMKQPQPQQQQRQELPSPPASVRRSRSLFLEAAEDIARRDVASCAEKENQLPPSTDPVAADVDMEDESKPTETIADAITVLVAEAVTNSEPPVTPLRPRRTRSSPHTTDSFQTPQRTNVNAAVTIDPSLDDCAFRTPAHGVAIVSAAAPPASTAAISPAPSFDKVAVVHAKDTPGKVDKFEWTIRSSPPLTRAATATGAKRSLSDELVTPTSCDSSLPPRYLRDAASSPQKRRVHSSTFGSFARSFSFTDAS